MPISVKIPPAQTTHMITNWKFTNPACPSWSSLSDESAVRSALDNLKDGGSSLHFWFKAWTAFVVVGVILEIVFCICEYLEERHELRFCDLLPRTVPTLWLFVFALFAASLVGVGVSGELKVEGQIETLESCVREGNSALYLLLSKEAGDAADSAKKAREEATAAGSIAKAADISAGKAQEEAATVSKQSGQLTRDLQSVEDKRAKLQQSLVNLAVCTAPRVLPIQVIVGKETSVDRLKPFAGFQAVIEVVRDAEARRAAGSIAASLVQAGWNPPTLTFKDDIRDGVAVQQFVGPLGGSMHLASIRSGEAASAVVKFLHRYNWQAKLTPLVDETGVLIEDPQIVPPNGLRIRVGLYPATTLVVPPGAADFAALEAEQGRKREASTKQFQANLDKERLKGLMGAEAARVKAEIDNWRAWQSSLIDEYTFNPCQPLDVGQ